MGARQKLNNVYLTGALLVAGIAGLLTKSWMIFLIVAAVLIACSIHDGGIRLGRRR